MACDGKDNAALNCCVCTEQYHCPKLLPCFHTFCQRCVEGVAGTKPSFPCPVCRTITILPLGGAAELQTNLFVEKDLVRAMADRDPQCQLCTSGSPALVKCVQCQQLYCQTCRQTHDAIPACSSHTMLPLGEAVDTPQPQPTPGEDKPPRPPRNCTQHRQQPMTLFCRQCDVSICAQCKTTSHSGHETGVARPDSYPRAKAEMQQTLETVTKQEQALKALLSQAEDFQAELDKEKRGIESDIHARTEKLQSVIVDEKDRALRELENMVVCLRSNVERQSKPVLSMLEAVRAKRAYMGRVVDRSDDSDILKLLGDLKTDEEMDAIAENLKKTTIERSSILLKYNDSAVNQTDVKAFIGSATEGAKYQVKIQTMRTLSVLSQPKGAKEKNPADVFNDNISRKAVGEIVYSKNPGVTMVDMCLATDERLWVLYYFEGTGLLMAYLSKEGRRLEHRYESLNVHLPQRLACEGDTLVLLPCGKYAAPDGKFGELGRLAIDTTFGWLLSRPSPDYYVLKRTSVGQTPPSPRSSQVSNVAESVDITRIASLTSSPPKLETTALCSGIDPNGIVGNYTKTATVFAVSSDETFFAFVSSGSVYVYVKCSASLGEMKCIATYCLYDASDKRCNGVVDLTFTPVDGRELLVVVSEQLKAVHFVDHRDGCCLVLVAEQDDFDETDRPLRVTANGRGRIWVGCHGGKILVYDL